MSSRKGNLQGVLQFAERKVEGRCSLIRCWSFNESLLAAIELECRHIDTHLRHRKAHLMIVIRVKRRRGRFPTVTEIISNEWHSYDGEIF